MGGTVSLTIGGAPSGTTGVVTVPSSLLFGQLSDSTSLNSLLQGYLGGLTAGFNDGTASFENVNLVTNATDVAPSSVTGAPVFEEFTNVSNSVTGGGGGNYAATVGSGVTDLAVQVPGNVTLLGASATTTALFGAGSNVDYTVVDPAAGTLYLAGGNDSVTLLSNFANNAETIYSAGNDSINLKGEGTDYVSVYGNGTVLVQNADAVVTAEGNATTNVFWDNAAGGTLNFTNNSSVAATIHINPAATGAKVTAYGGAGGGYFVGGTSGSNSLVGGSGVVTLVGGGSNDFLEAQGYTTIGSGNIFVAAAGTNETMIATSATGANFFSAGLNYPGGTGNPAASGVISTQGSGVQNFSLGNSPGETIYGSTQTGASNAYLFTNTATFGGGVYSIYNFINNASNIYLTNGAGGAGTASVTSMNVDSSDPTQFDIKLADGTQILLKGLTSQEISNISVNNNGFGEGMTIITG
jgi:hypothetical protein